MCLLDLSDYLSALLNTFSTVIDLELTVINKDPLIRVAQTGDFYNKDKTISTPSGAATEGFAKSYSLAVIKEGAPRVQIDTSDYVRTRPELLAYDEGRYYSLLLYPIRLDDEIIGVIVAASFTERQQQILLKKQDQLMQCLASLCDLVSSKLKEEILHDQVRSSNTQLNSVLEAVPNGLILYSPENGILQINRYAEYYLHFSDEAVKQELLREVLSFARSCLAQSASSTRNIHKKIENVTFSIQVQAILIPGDQQTILCQIIPYSQVVSSLLQEDDSAELSKEIVFSSSKMRKLVGQANIVATKNVNVLITGESGTGKELMARFIHNMSFRKNKPFISINCAAIPEALLESELFGYEEGAFTGAKRGGKIGKFVLADKGTLFLDEIGELPLHMQAKLLRVLSERKVDPVGGTTPIDIDVRIVAATNRNLEEMIKNKEFREDLYYRLCVVPINLPPLRERSEDIFILTSSFVKKYNEILGKNILGIREDTISVLRQYNWPGNIRELENCIEFMMTFEENSLLSPDNLPPRIRRMLEEMKSQEEPSDTGRPKSLKQLVEEYERNILLKAAAACGENPTTEDLRQLCSSLGISLASYYRKIKMPES